MSRKNFYILLELPFDPPEMDSKIIAKAIKKKQALWSRMRNHPTKGIAAKQNIDLIPEIKKVMVDPELRKKEAIDAKAQATKTEQESFVEVDRHIELRMSKGFLSADEIKKLAEHHKMKIEDIQKRIKIKEDEKYKEIDKNLETRSGKGYITEQELASLAQLFSIQEDKLRKRVKVPIQKGAKKAKEGVVVKELDKSIEKVINDNLKVVGKKSLYDFLELPTDTQLNTLLAASERLKHQFQKISRKDAVVTASNILAGQCMTIFKSEESKSAYDVGRSKHRLEKFNSDIDVAGMDGTIREEFMDMLVQTGVKLGMTPDEAKDYIIEYCKDKKWQVEIPKDEAQAKKRRFQALLVAGIFVLCTAIIGIIGVFYMQQSASVEVEYQELLAQVDKIQNLEEKANILNGYIDSHQAAEFTANAQKRLAEIENKLFGEAFSKLKLKAAPLEQEGKLKELLSLYSDYLKTDSNTEYAQKVKEKIKELREAIEKKNYARLKEIELQEVDVRIAKYLEFKKENPHSKRVKEIDQLLKGLAPEYYSFIKIKLKALEKDEKWLNAFKLCDSFIKLYKDNTNIAEFKQLQSVYATHIRDEKQFNQMVKDAKTKGIDFDGAEKIFKDYINSYPNSTVGKKVKTEIARIKKERTAYLLEQRMKKLNELISETNGRFKLLEGGKIVEETKTKRMWTLEDAEFTLKKCLTWEEAKQFVKDLRTGGYKDWRLPTEKELIRIYKKEPFFPTLAKKWYWASDNEKRYESGTGWITTVSIVDSQKETSWDKDQKGNWECGTVRAVRP